MTAKRVFLLLLLAYLLVACHSSTKSPQGYNNPEVLSAQLIQQANSYYQSAGTNTRVQSMNCLRSTGADFVCSGYYTSGTATDIIRITVSKDGKTYIVSN